MNYSLVSLVVVLLISGTWAQVPKPIKVSGNKLVDSSGNTVILHGVDRSGTEFACVQPGNLIFNGPNDQTSVTAMKSWKINSVRIPLNEDCWLGINGLPSSVSGAAYRTAVSNFVHLFLQNGIYVILDLHWTAAGSTVATKQDPMPNKDHSIDFWRSVAAFFKGNDTIIFDLFNEPYPGNNVWDNAAAWQCWRNGGTCSGISFQVAGMQDLVTAVRSTGATNVIIIGGLAYANSLAQWITYLPNDTQHNIAASWHSYNFNYCNSNSCWQQYILPVSQHYPIVIGELGEDDCASGYTNGLTSWADQNKLSYLAWTWNNWDCKSGPSLITDYTGTATAYGAGYKAHLASLE